MNPNLDPKTVWPGARAARRRLLRITLVLLPLSLVVFALLVRDWKLNLPEWSEETRRHLAEWLVVLVAAIAVTFLTGLLPAVQRFFDWLHSRRVIRKMLIGLAWLVTVVVLLYAEEDWRGWHMWNNCRQQLGGWRCAARFAGFHSQTGSRQPKLCRHPGHLNPGSRREPISPKSGRTIIRWRAA